MEQALEKDEVLSFGCVVFKILVEHSSKRYQVVSWMNESRVWK